MASQAVLARIIPLVKKQTGTLLTQGCNTPIMLYQLLAKEAAAQDFNLLDLLGGELGDFHWGMIDGTETELANPLSFPYYFCQFFLTFLLEQTFEEQLELSLGREAQVIKRILADLRHVYSLAAKASFFGQKNEVC